MYFIESFLEGITGICFILMPVLLVLVILIFSHKREKERYRLIQQMIDKGEDPEKIIPLLDKGKKEAEKSPTKHFKSGIIWLCIGLGTIAVALINNLDISGFGAFFAIIGLGELAIAWYLRKYSK